MKIDEALKNRIIGAVVITLLAAIFLPLFLDDAQETLSDRELLALPKESSVNKMGLTTEELPNNIDDVIENIHAQPLIESDEGVPLPEPISAGVVSEVVLPPATVTSPPPTAIKKASQEKRWYVQVASFNREDNAYTFKEKLKSQGFSAIVDTTTSLNGRSMYRVRVGPQTDRNHAKTTQVKINKLNKVKSITLFSN
jgi:DedD protein